MLRRPASAVVHRGLRPLQEFLQTETAGSVLLLGAALGALIWANVGGDSYTEFWGRHITLGLGMVELDLTLGEWVSDGLMAIFFFVAGMEIKRELVRGELADRQRAALPVAAALGGMLAPAAIYLSLNAGGAGEDGWGIPMATDIAFSVGVLALLGSRVPIALKVFLLALAIVDDLGAIAVIALFYTDDLALGWLAFAVVLFALTAVLIARHVRFLPLYGVIALAAWIAVHESGVHATVAGVVLGLIVPAGPFGGGDGHARAPTSDDDAPLDQLEHALHPWTSYAIIPLFALANAGVQLTSGAIGDALSSPVSWGILLGLIIGKPAGILAGSYVAVRLRLAVLPASTNWGQVLSLGMVAGIGFTVSLFITGLAFENAKMIEEAKLGILAGSALAGGLGFAAVRLMMRTPADAAPDT